MLLPHRTIRDPDFRAWLQGVLAGDEAYGMSDLVLSGFLRVVTNPRVFNVPTPLDIALEVTRVRSQENRVPILPGPRHWSIFTVNRALQLVAQRASWLAERERFDMLLDLVGDRLGQTDVGGEAWR